MITRILLPTDGSDGARPAEDHALQLAEAYGATLHALYVVDVERAAYDVDEGTEHLWPRIRRLLRERGTRAVERIRAAGADRGLDVVTAIEEGTPADAICAYADRTAIDLVVIGTRGRSGLSRILLGSVAARVIRRASAPVLAVKTHAPTTVAPYGSIVVATDGSPGADAAATLALDIAARFGTTVDVVSVVDAKIVRSRGHRDALERGGTAAAETIRVRAAERGVRATTTILHGTPARSIAAHADAVDADLIAVGTAGRSGIERIVLGSVTDRLLHTGPVPILTVRANE
ncbi:universal stress protein (plasmid) [Haloferacaceae archaeon DSL9]